MVVFNCNHCGDTLPKPKVAKHYQFRCRNAPFLTCADCLKDFRGEEYTVHIKCITEAERYGGKDYVPKPSANKGERKQQEWICVVKNLLNSTIELTTAEKSFLNNLSKYENIPRKKAKFLNFVHNAMGRNSNIKVIESIWDKMETMHKQNQPSIVQIQNQAVQTLEDNNKKDTHHTDSINSLNNQNIVENQNNENICRENSSAKHENENDKVCMSNNDVSKKQKKSKKRQLESINVQTPEEEQSVAKTLKTFDIEININENDIPFNWKETVLSVIQTKGELSLKKLQSNIIKKYVRHTYNSRDMSNLTNFEHDKAIAKFNKTLKKLKKASTICVLEHMVKLP